MLPTPKLPFKREDYLSFYEPAEDSFLLLDGIEKDLNILKACNPSLIMELGPGSGIGMSFLSILFPFSHCLGIDINPRACAATLKTAAANKCIVEVVNGDLLTSLRPGCKADIIIFNPPYVLTGQEEVARSKLEQTWAGGINGRVVIDRVLPAVKQFLADRGYFYLIVINENGVEDIRKEMEDRGFSSAVVMYRVAGWEGLSLLRFQNRVEII